jgi:hypothetical protein
MTAVKRTAARVNFEISDELAEKLKRLPWGTRTTLIRILLERIADAIEKHGEIMIGAIMSGEFAIVYTPSMPVPPRNTSTGKRA